MRAKEFKPGGQKRRRARKTPDAGTLRRGVYRATGGRFDPGVAVYPKRRFGILQVAFQGYCCIVVDRMRQRSRRVNPPEVRGHGGAGKRRMAMQHRVDASLIQSRARSQATSIPWCALHRLVLAPPRTHLHAVLPGSERWPLTARLDRSQLRLVEQVDGDDALTIRILGVVPDSIRCCDDCALSRPRDTVSVASPSQCGGLSCAQPPQYGSIQVVPVTTGAVSTRKV